MSFVVTAVVAAVELGTVAAIATAVTQVGIAMTVVGTVTKSKELTKIGGILSLAGGVTSLANAAYGAATGAASGAAGTAAGNAAGELGSDSMWSELSNQAVADINANAAASGLGNITVDSFAGAASADAGASLAADGIGSIGDKLASTAASEAADKGAQSLVGAATDSATKSVAENGLSDAASNAVSNATSDAATTAAKASAEIASGGTASAPGLGQSIKDWYGALTPDAKTRVGTTILQAGGSAIGSMFQGWSADKRLELEKEIRDEQRKNANAVPSVTYKKPGLVNSVTGAK